MRTFVVLSLVASVLALGCTWLVPFDTLSGSACDAGACVDSTAGPDVPDATSTGDTALDAPAIDAGFCVGMADGAACGVDDPCHDTPTCAAGICVPHAKPDGTPCAAALDACHGVPMCQAGVCGASAALPDGTQWTPGDDTARCCGGKPVKTTTDTNCGVCGIVCNTAKGQSCGVVDSEYFCVGCTVIPPAMDPDCWSGCCSQTDTPHCTPSDCTTSACHVPDLCPDMSRCQMGAVVNYCSY